MINGLQCQVFYSQSVNACIQRLTHAVSPTAHTGAGISVRSAAVCAGTKLRTIASCANDATSSNFVADISFPFGTVNKNKHFVSVKNIYTLR